MMQISLLPMTSLTTFPIKITWKYFLAEQNDYVIPKSSNFNFSSTILLTTSNFIILEHQGNGSLTTHLNLHTKSGKLALKIFDL